MKGLLDLVQHGVAHRLPGLAGQRGGRTGERGDQLVLLPGRRTKLLGVERPVGLTQRLPQHEELVGLLGPMVGQEVRRPCPERGPAQRRDRLHRLGILRLTGLGNVSVPRGGELLRPQPVQLFGDLLGIHIPTVRRRLSRADHADNRSAK
ncbi:hypothetical protein [Streptomyces sp. WAC01280]|uniref:hypothetical protein n=1 Tax=Streptomyces sp. WAC01280 TaxID=2487424 RepID=UPI000F78343F|nr:hypothetical protein [Streptomyces sp. WAC01280]RSS57512.1 hypothetical protein EF909_16390 [Streptomyces sp. WAC01280]